MKKLTKSLVAATLALGAVSANAAIIFDNSSNASAWMSVYDASSKNTFTLDLGSVGLNWSTLIAEKNATGVVHNIDLSAYADWNTFKSTANLTTTEYLIASAGVTSLVKRPAFMLTGADNTFFGNKGRPSVEGISATLNSHAVHINSDNTDPMLTHSSPDTTLVNDGQTAQGKHGGSISLWNGSNYNPNTAYGQAADFNLITLHSANRRTSSTQEVFASQFKLAGDSLTLSAVPVPAAVWMFASALLGLAGISRKRNAV